MSDPSPLPPSLLARLTQDRTSLETSLTTDPVPSATPQVRDYAHRRLLSLVPKSLDTLDYLLESAAPPERLRAALSIIDRSPATKDSAPQSATPLNPALLAPLLEGLAKLFTGHSPPPIPEAQEASFSIVPQDKESPND